MRRVFIGNLFPSALIPDATTTSSLVPPDKTLKIDWRLYSSIFTVLIWIELDLTLLTEDEEYEQDYEEEDWDNWEGEATTTGQKN